MRSAANTHRALKQDEAKEKREVNSELLEDVLTSDNLAQAWKRVKANKGAPGIDGVTIEDFPDHARAHWPAVRQQIKEGRYQPQAVRRVEIPKADGGKRLLGIPTVMDRVIQQAIAQVLTPIFDPTFSESSFGFRPGRNAHQAIRQVQRHVPELDEWIRRRMRMCYWKRWRWPRTKIKNLLALGVSLKSAIQHGCSSNSYWQMSRTPVINQAVSNAWLKEQGLLSVKDLWCKAQGYTAKKGKTSSSEPTC